MNEFFDTPGKLPSFLKACKKIIAEHSIAQQVRFELTLVRSLLENDIPFRHYFHCCYLLYFRLKLVCNYFVAVFA